MDSQKEYGTRWVELILIEVSTIYFSGVLRMTDLELWVPSVAEWKYFSKSFPVYNKRRFDTKIFIKRLNDKYSKDMSF